MGLSCVAAVLHEGQRGRCGGGDDERTDFFWSFLASTVGITDLFFVWRPSGPSNFIGRVCFDIRSAGVPFDLPGSSARARFHVGCGGERREDGWRQADLLRQRSWICQSWRPTVSGKGDALCQGSDRLYGIACKDIVELAEVCAERGWWLIICESMETEAENGQLVGTFGDFGVASLYANKPITARDGGWVHARDAKHHDHLKSLLNHGFDPAYHFLHFETAPNAKMNGLGAAFACSQVKLLPQIMEHRGQLAVWYREFLAGLRGLTCIEAMAHDAPWVFGVEVADRTTRDRLRDHLALHGVETRNFFTPSTSSPSIFNRFAASRTLRPGWPLSSIALLPAARRHYVHLLCCEKFLRDPLPGSRIEKSLGLGQRRAHEVAYSMTALPEL